jgi:hypothetical protein
MATIYSQYKAQQVAVELELSDLASDEPWEFWTVCQHHEPGAMVAHFQECPAISSIDDNCIWWKVAAIDEQGAFVGYW